MEHPKEAVAIQMSMVDEGHIFRYYEDVCSYYDDIIKQQQDDDTN